MAALAGKRVALVSSGGGGAVWLVGVTCVEEAGLEPAEIVGCCGGAIWGWMWAAGMSWHELAEFWLLWTPEDDLDIQWLGLPRFALSALSGFTGLAKGEAIEPLFDARLRALRCKDTPIPITTIVYTIDLGTVEHPGSTRTPEVTIGHLVGVAIALPLFIESLRVGEQRYVDGAIIENRPAEPALQDGGFDHVFGLSLMLPAGFRPKDISGRPDRLGGILEAGRQLGQGYHLELARRAQQRLGNMLTPIEPVDASQTRRTTFDDPFIDRGHRPRPMRHGYDEATKEVSNGLRDAEASAEGKSPGPATPA